jgi:hypothetical protein
MLCVLMAPGLTFGADVIGQNDPRFRAALDLWLAEDDETALPEFAALAAGGNRAAQVLLAHIDATMPLQAPWLASLPRAERIALMRQPGGVSGRSWISAAATDTPLAAAWSALWSAADRDEVEVPRAFAAMGEPRAVRMALTAMSLHKSRGFAAMADDPSFPKSMRFLIWREWLANPATEPLVAAEIAALPLGDPQIATVTGRQASASERAAWLAEATPARPLRALCSVTCPANPTSCVQAAAFAMTTGADLGAEFGSPVESLIPSLAWEASPRGRASVLRRTLPIDPQQRAYKIAEITGQDACLGAAVAADAARFVK